MRCHFTHEPCKYIECRLYKEEADDCKFALALDKYLEPEPEPKPEPVELTPKQTRILRLLAKGLSNNEISQAMSIAESTVKNHVAALMKKLGAHGRMQAVIIAMKRGMVSIKPE